MASKSDHYNMQLLPLCTLKSLHYYVGYIFLNFLTLFTFCTSVQQVVVVSWCLTLRKSTPPVHSTRNFSLTHTENRYSVLLWTNNSLSFATGFCPHSTAVLINNSCTRCTPRSYEPLAISVANSSQNFSANADRRKILPRRKKIKFGPPVIFPFWRNLAEEKHYLCLFF
jgi:hypothetical protein